MQFQLEKSMEILQSTPDVLKNLLQGLSPDWTIYNEGGETWSPYDVLGHLIHGEKTDWIPRLQIILQHGTQVPFEPFDRFAQFQKTEKQSITSLLEEFSRLRIQNLRLLKMYELDEKALNKKGLHPAFGEVSLRQLLAAWTVHDLGHLVQISRVMAKQYTDAVGPWTQYLRVLDP